MSGLFDSNPRYGALARVLHWSMALLLAWQFVTVLAHVYMEGSDLDRLAWATHKEMGLVLMGLALIRVLWALVDRKRPAPVSVMARLGHLVLYVLMLVVPAVALLRQYGSGREFIAFGYSVMPGFDTGKIEWMLTPGNLLHGNLGWVMLALVVGHVAMVFVHRRVAGGDVLARMIGR